jgi:hypothetical protein
MPACGCARESRPRLALASAAQRAVREGKGRQGVGANKRTPLVRLDGAHIEYFRGIANPIGVKVSAVGPTVGCAAAQSIDVRF